MWLARVIDTSCTNSVYMLRSPSEIVLLTYFSTRLYSFGLYKTRSRLATTITKYTGLAYWLHPGTGMHDNRAYFRHYRHILGYTGAVLRAAVIVHIGVRVGSSCWGYLLADA